MIVMEGRTMDKLIKRLETLEADSTLAADTRRMMRDERLGVLAASQRYTAAVRDRDRVRRGHDPARHSHVDPYVHPCRQCEELVRLQGIIGHRREGLASRRREAWRVLRMWAPDSAEVRS